MTIKFTERSAKDIKATYELARRHYAALGVDTEAALDALDGVAIALNCWQGDDIRGFETKEGFADGGGIMATGNYPGAARNGTELRADLAKALTLIPGKNRINIHAIYAETDDVPVSRDQIRPEHFRKWQDWALKAGLKLDFNTSCFAHPMANSGYTLSSADEKVRQFWIRHALSCRKIAEALGRAQKSACGLNHWMPDGAKDNPVDRWGPRQRMIKSLDQILSAPINRKFCADSVEGKLFGIGSEDYVVGSHEFYLSYVMSRNNALLCLDMGHFHPTETIHDKVSAILSFQKELQLHVSRGIRWDSDHVVIVNDDLRLLFQELVRGRALPRVRLALDYFDASLNRIGAWVIGTRSTQKAILLALLEPLADLRRLSDAGNQAGKLALLEEAKHLPAGAVWEMFCLKYQVPVGPAWLNELQVYEDKVQFKRG